jgi:anti-sigma factor RsiW
MHERLPCEQVEVGIAEFLDGALPRALQRRFEAHLRSCEECGDQLQRIGWTIDHLSGVPRESMPPWMKLPLLLAWHGTAAPRPLSLHFRAPPVPSPGFPD